MITAGSGVPTPQEPEITEEMIERGAKALTEPSAEIYSVRVTNPESARRFAEQVLAAALAGRTVVELPEPDLQNEDGIPVWVVTGGEVHPVNVPGVARVATPFDYRKPEGAERYGLAFVAAAREARRLASVSRKDGETSGD